MEKFTNQIAYEKSAKVIQDLLNEIDFQTPVDAGKTLGVLIMLTVRCLDQVMGGGICNRNND